MCEIGEKDSFMIWTKIRKSYSKHPNKVSILAGHHGSKTAFSSYFCRHLLLSMRYSAGRFNGIAIPMANNKFQRLNINLSSYKFEYSICIPWSMKNKTTLRGDETSWTLPNYLHN